ncbi:beta-glucosidase BglX [Halotalea alkalilenta]|uniref:beta-glucosidase n=1 Tax=Halotalea alkalilenta TaxID=376489 RepID=A0A172YJV1_9GAMM|nr:beta-glucosidase BglX [Halotalea alkalilenta]ANF59489.1 glycosyl hydrolase [Halotalea alkalilenta]
MSIHAPSALKVPYLGLAPARLAELERRAEALLARMTLEEKIGQMTQFTSERDVTGPSVRDDYEQDIRAGRVGSVFNSFDADFTRRMQRLAVEGSRLGIPLLFGYDVIHGFRTIFPIPLAMASSWHLEAIEAASRVAAREAASAGIHWVFTPMVDISRDPRWGRVMEGAGEDPLLGSLVAAAQVRGLQGESIEALDSVAACVKHYAAYGAAEAGRDYNGVDISERLLRSVYLPPFKAAVDSGVATLMTAFNALDGVPASCNSLLLDQILRREWGFEGLVVTDYTAVMELIHHGVAEDSKDAARLAVNAGVDMDMQDGYFLDHLAELVAEEAVDGARIDQAVKRILVLKYALGLFDDPYRYSDEQRERTTLLTPEHLETARSIARDSMVLLENDGLLPLSSELERVALIGPLADSHADLLGPWHGDGRAEEVTSVLEALGDRLPDALITHSRGVPKTTEHGHRRKVKEAIDAAVREASQAQVAILVLGERESMSGEAASRADIGLPGHQLELALKVIGTGTPTVVVTMSGRPLVLSELAPKAQALLHAWWPGTEGAAALVELLFGDHAPCARLPMSFPRAVGQLPLYYAQAPTGRPFDADERYTSKYLDVANTPLYPFGHGLGYTRIEYGTPRLDRDLIEGEHDTIELRIELSNQGERPGVEVVQLYLRDPVASISRPVRELIDFDRVTLEPGESREVSFVVSLGQLGFLGHDLAWRVEPGRFELHIGPDCQRTQCVGFDYRPAKRR